jgi:hypothetical protein
MDGCHDEKHFYTMLRAADQGILGSAAAREVTVNTQSIAGCRWHMARLKMTERVLWPLVDALARAEQLHGDM